MRIVAIALLVLAQVGDVRTAPRVGRSAIRESVRPTDISNRNSAIYGLVADETTVVRYPLVASRRDPVVFVEDRGGARHTLCLEIARAQGGYQARFSAEAPAGQGVLGIPFDSTPQARVTVDRARPTSLEMAVRATEPVGGRCDNKALLVPTSWTGRPTEGRYRLLVGASGLGNPSIRIAGGAMRECPTLSRLLGKPGMGAGTYSFACAVTSEAASCDRPTQATVVWFRGSRQVDYVNLTFRLPCR